MTTAAIAEAAMPQTLEDSSSFPGGVRDPQEDGAKPPYLPDIWCRCEHIHRNVQESRVT
jgi:hypothetical protein